MNKEKEYICLIEYIYKNYNKYDDMAVSESIKVSKKFYDLFKKKKESKYNQRIKLTETELQDYEDKKYYILENIIINNENIEDGFVFNRDNICNILIFVFEIKRLDDNKVMILKLNSTSYLIETDLTDQSLYDFKFALERLSFLNETEILKMLEKENVKISNLPILEIETYY